MNKKEFEGKMSILRKDYLNMTIKELEKKYNKEYSKLFKELNYEIKKRLGEYTDDMGNIRSVYLSKINADINEEIIRFNKDWGTMHKGLLKEVSKRAFSDTINIYGKMNINSLGEQIHWNKDIMDYLINYKAQDGLTVSERLWGHSKGIKNNLMERINKNILTGESVWNTMMEIQEIKSPNVTIPKYLKEDLKKMSENQIQKIVDLYTVKKTNYITQRLVEAEIERAYRTTSMKLIEEKEWIKGLKWNLSSKHKHGEYDCVCEDNSEKDNFGMGKGVYPIKYYPHMPAHPWCKCYDTEVFDDEYINEFIDSDGEKNKSKDDIINNENEVITETFRKYVPQDYANEIEIILKKAPKECIDVWNKYENKINIKDFNSKEGAYYAPYGNYVKFNIEMDKRNTLGNNTTVFHELGHLFDGNSGELSLNYKDGLFDKTIIEEADNYIELVMNEMQLKSEKRVYKKDVYKKIRDEIDVLPNNECGDISDIFQGATKNKISGKVGHPKVYWKDHNVSLEAFAEMYSASVNNKKSLEKIKKYFPKSYDVFLEILKEMVK